MKITKQTVKRIADLARLKLTDTELETAASDLAKVLEHFSAIQDIDTAGVLTADDASGLTDQARPDVADPETLADHKQLLENAPDTQNGQIKVKSVMNNE